MNSGKICHPHTQDWAVFGQSFTAPHLTSIFSASTHATHSTIIPSASKNEWIDIRLNYKIQTLITAHHLLFLCILQDVLMAIRPNVGPHLLHIHEFCVQRTTFPCTLALPDRKIPLIARVPVKAHFTLGEIHAVDVFEVFDVRRVIHTYCEAETAGGNML